MAAFKFEKILHIKKSLEMQKALELNKIERVRQQYLAEITKLENELGHLENRYLSQIKKGTLDQKDLQWQSQYAQLVSEKLQFLHRKLTTVLTNLSEKRKELVEAARERKTFERLQEKFFIKESEKREKQENAFLNEIANLYHQKRVSD